LQKWIGTDESGKGDYFGPLVIAGILLTSKDKNKLLRLGVKDSKLLSNKRVRELSEKVKGFCVYSVVVINPLRYNQLISRMHSLNRLLAWGHARVIENILEKEDCEYAISDKFGDEHYILDALLRRGRKIKLQQMPKAESDIGVACASILARSEFIRRIEQLSSTYGLTLPRGASEKVVIAGREFIKRYGKERLGEVAKIHFKTTSKLVGG